MSNWSPAVASLIATSAQGDAIVATLGRLPAHPKSQHRCLAIAGTALRARQFPQIRFASSEAVRRDGGAIEVRGALSIAGASRPVALAVRPEGERLATSVRLHQPDLGIAPYRAVLGALRVKPDVIVRASVPAAGL